MFIETDALLSYRKKYYQDNAEHNRAYSLKYYYEHRDECLRKQKKWYLENKDFVKLRSRKYYDAHKDIIKEKERQRRLQNPEKKREAERKWMANNPERCRENRLRWRRENPEKVRISNKKSMEKHRKKYIATQRASRLRNKLECFEAYGGAKCNRCGFDDIRALQLDHVNGGGSKELRERPGLYSKLRLAGFPDKHKYQILCANCNWIKRTENRECRKRS